ncbi:MAG: hypothetical protein RIA64_09475 [Rhodospirillales bacterium]
MFTQTRFKIVPAIVLGLALVTAQTALAANPYDTMSDEEIADHQSLNLIPQQGEIVQPKPQDPQQLAALYRTMSDEEIATHEESLGAVTIVTPDAAGSDD